MPDNFDAKAMLNIFQKYGNIVEVVIPTKRDKGGRRFGFARFDNRPLHREGGKMNKDFNNGKYTGSHHVSRQSNIKQGVEGDRSYANIARHEDVGRQKEGSKKIILSFNSNQDELQRLKKMFIGETVEEEVEREAVEKNLLAIILLNVNNELISVTNHEEEGSIFREGRLDESTNFGIDSNLILSQLNSSKAIEDGGYEERFTASRDGDLLGQEVGIDGPAKPINSCHEEIGGVKSRKSKSENLGLISPIMTDSNKGGKKEVKGSVNKIGPVVKKNSLVTGPNFNPPKQTKAIGKAPIVKPVHRKTDPTSSKIPIPWLPSSMRKQN
ncbi:unnamed protein product [Trifolium pratense]|uniref:Uncharacterized protein n=1 Tax=Trifolium pratense TaxID=57577 RepID=A0ACB0IZZ0_TRIPR|nr:unnamed protein product [Trifolium pratense]